MTKSKLKILPKEEIVINEEKGVNESADLNAYKSFADFLESGFKKFSDSIAFENMGKTISYHELDILSQYFSLYLTEELKWKP